MATKQELQALLERIEKATGSDREIDADILCLLIPPFELGDKLTPKYTASIDAALWLVEGLLPGCGREIVNEAIDDTLRPLPLAIIAALLKALIAQADEVAA